MTPRVFLIGRELSEGDAEVRQKEYRIVTESTHALRLECHFTTTGADGLQDVLRIEGECGGANVTSRALLLRDAMHSVEQQAVVGLIQFRAGETDMSVVDRKSAGTHSGRIAERGNFEPGIVGNGRQRETPGEVQGLRSRIGEEGRRVFDRFLVGRFRDLEIVEGDQFESPSGGYNALDFGCLVGTAGSEENATQN